MLNRKKKQIDNNYLNSILFLHIWYCRKARFRHRKTKMEQIDTMKFWQEFVTMQNDELIYLLMTAHKQKMKSNRFVFIRIEFTFFE